MCEPRNSVTCADKLWLKENALGEPKMWKLVGLGLSAALFASTAAAQDKHDVFGTYLPQAGTSTVTIDPEIDKSYASRLKRRDDGRLEVKGCIGPICQTQLWDVAPDALQASAPATN